MLLQALARASEAASLIGARAVLVHAKDDRARSRLPALRLRAVIHAPAAPRHAHEGHSQDARGLKGRPEGTSRISTSQPTALAHFCRVLTDQAFTAPPRV